MVPIPSQAAILRAAKAVPGGARPTPAPQGSGDVGPYFGRFSPLAAELANERGYANAYSPFLPRPARTFTEGAFGPFSPILPVPVDAPAPGADLPDPRRFDYPVGWNLPSIPGQDGFRLASFATLETLSRLYSVARTCIQRRKMTIGGLEWDIVPTREAAKAYQGDHAAMRDFGERRSEAVRFFGKPDPNYFSFDSFMSALLEQVFVFDALSLVMRPKRGRGLHKGILGSDLDCLELIDGQTIRPLLGLHGEMPRPPAPYVQQYIQGVPRSDFQSMWDGRDIEEAGLKGYEGPAFSSDQLLYLPTVPRANSPYGMSAVEMALVVIMTGLQKQAYQLNYYNEGTVPAVYISPGDMTMTPAQIRELQGALNGFASDQAWHHKIIVTPPGSKIDPQRPASLADQFDEIIMASVAMVFDVDPMSLGIIPAVSTAVSPFAAKEMAESSRTVHERTSTKPLLKFLASIANSLLHRVMSQDDMKFTFSGMDEANDQAAQTDMLVKQVQSGLISIDEAREELQRTAWGLDETSGPLVFTQMGPVPLNQVIEMMRQQQPMQGGQTAAANSGNSVTASHQPRAVHHPPSSRPVGTHNPRLGLPAGSGGADLAPSPGGASDTPAHAAARAHQAAGKRKAVMAELEALARQVRKGRHIATWIPEHIPGVIMASLAEDLTKGIGIDEAVRDALALPEDAYEWVEKAGPQQNQSQRQQAQALAQQYAAQVRAVFGQVAAQAARLIAQWLSGALAVTAAALAAMITALLAKLLEPVLRRLWADAWILGRDAAAGILGAEAPSGSDDDAAFQAWADSHGRDWLEQITDTHEDDVAAGLYEAGSAGEDAETIASRIGDWLDAAGRSVLIAVDQVQRAFAAGMAAVARKLGVMQKSWITRNDAKVCFPGGTPIATPGGPVPIERLRPGDLVITPQGQRPVRATMARPYAGGLTAITAEGRTVTATDNHPFMTIAGWREASDLKPGDFLKTRGDQVAEITSVVHLALAKPDHVPAHRGKSLIPGGVLLGRPLMPVFAVGFDGHAGVRKGEVDRPLADVEFLRERDPEQREGLPDAELQEGLARVPAIAATGAELALSVGSIGPRPELGAAGLAGHVDGGTPALLGAEVSVEVLLGTKPLAAPLAVDVHGVSGLAGVRADSVAVRDGLRDLEVLSAGRAVPGDPAAGDAAFQGAVFAGPVPALLGRVEDLPAARAFPALVDDGSGAIEALRGAEAALAPESLTTHEDFSAFIAGVRKGHRNGVSTSYVNGGNSLIVYNVMVEDEHVYYANDFLVHNCGKCKANQDQGWVNFGAPYPSGQLSPPGHPRCRCHESYRVSLNPAQKLAGGRRYVDLPGQEWWPADSYPSGPAMGGGGPQHAAHDADDIQQYVPGGVPGMTAGGEPPRWGGSEAEALVTVSPGTDSAGRGNVPTRGGGTAGGPYRDFSGETHNDAPEDADDAAWPGERAVGPVAGRSWPLQGYGGGYWPQGGHGTAQAPVTSIGATERGRPPNAVGKGASGYSLNPRSGMISLDLPEGTINPVPGGVTDHHITVVYLGPDVDDEAFAAACARAAETAASMPGPLVGAIKGVGSFPASDSSDGKVPAWAGVMLPGGEQLREALEDLSASEHKNWKPHVTLAYVEPGEALPDPLPVTPVTFTHLSVHRGDEVARFPLGPVGGIAKGASDLSDPNPVDSTHVLALMEKNFPLAALGWVKNLHWIGPVHVPLDRIDFRDEDSWAASHEPGAVKRFAKAMKHGAGHTQPVILVQSPEDQKAVVIDGRHRTLACRKLGWPVKAYVGMADRVNPEMLETHSSQVHSGSDPANKAAGNAETLREYWTHEAHPGPTHFAYADQVKWGTPGDFDRAVSLLMEHAHMTEEQAKGYANLEHHRALGYWPAQHAAMERGK